MLLTTPSLVKINLKTDISVKQTLNVGPCLFLHPFLSLFKMDISLRWTLSTCPKGVYLRVDRFINYL